MSLSADTKFAFNCNASISRRCHAKCCKGGRLFLHPYDILSVSRKLGITSQEFLEKYTYYHIDEKTSLILVILKMPCPFLRSGACSIYTVRPLSCRYFPVGADFSKKALGRETVCDVSYRSEEHTSELQSPY